MKRILETDDMGEEEIIKAYDGLKTLDLVNDYFLERAMELCPKGRILDIGCGTGKMLRSIKGDYEKYGLDIDKRMIEHARKQDNGTEYEIGDSNNLPYETGHFDLVMCHSLLHHLKDPRQTISEILRVAKPQGAVFIRDLIRPATESILQRYFLGYLASHYDEQNKRLFENSLRSSFTFDEWRKFYPKGIDTSKVFIYNIAERKAKGVKLDPLERKIREIEFIQKRLTEPLIYGK